jgi:hypothetical protein
MIALKNLRTCIVGFALSILLACGKTQPISAIFGEYRESYGGTEEIIVLKEDMSFQHTLSDSVTGKILHAESGNFKIVRGLITFSKFTEFYDRMTKKMNLKGHLYTRYDMHLFRFDGYPIIIKPHADQDYTFSK